MTTAGPDLLTGKEWNSEDTSECKLDVRGVNRGGHKKGGLSRVAKPLLPIQFDGMVRGSSSRLVRGEAASSGRGGEDQMHTTPKRRRASRKARGGRLVKTGRAGSSHRRKEEAGGGAVVGGGLVKGCGARWTLVLSLLLAASLPRGVGGRGEAAVPLHWSPAQVQLCPSELRLAMIGVFEMHFCTRLPTGAPRS